MFRFIASSIICVFFVWRVEAEKPDYFIEKGGCSLTLAVLGLTYSDIEPLSEEAVEALYHRKVSDPNDHESIHLLARSYVRLLAQRVGGYASPNSQIYSDLIEMLYHNDLVGAVKAFRQDKRGTSTADKPIKYNLASFIVHYLRHRIPKYYYRLVNRQEIATTDIILKSQSDGPIIHASIEHIANRQGQTFDGIRDLDESIGNTNVEYMVVRIREAAERYFTEKLGTAPHPQTVKRVELERIILNELLAGTMHQIQFVQKHGVSRTTVGLAVSSLREGILEQSKQDPFLAEILSEFLADDE